MFGGPWEMKGCIIAPSISESQDNSDFKYTFYRSIWLNGATS